MPERPAGPCPFATPPCVLCPGQAPGHVWMIDDASGDCGRWRRAEQINMKLGPATGEMMIHEYRGYRILVRRTPQLEASILTPGVGFSMGKTVHATPAEGEAALLRRAYALIDQDVVEVLETRASQTARRDGDGG